MADEHDGLQRLRRRLKPNVHRLMDRLGGYAMSDTPEAEYVATFDCSVSELERTLADTFGFRRNPLSALKVRIDGNVSDGSWVWRRWPLAARQLHLVLHETDDGVDVYAHWEYSWVTHPLRHYRADGYDAEAGVAAARALLFSPVADLDWIDPDVEQGLGRWPRYVSAVRKRSHDLARTLADKPDRYEGALGKRS